MHRDLAKAGVDAGLRSPVVLTRAAADLARFAIGTERARAAVTVAQSVLAAAVGVPEPGLDVACRLARPPPARMLLALDAVRAAAARDPVVLEAEARLRAEEKSTRAIGAQLRPDLSLTSTLSLRAGGAPASTTGVNPGVGLPNVPNYDVGLVLRWPISSTAR